MSSKNVVFEFNDDGLFDITTEDASRISGGIQTSIGEVASEDHAGFFCTNEDSCK